MRFLSGRAGRAVKQSLAALVILLSTVVRPDDAQPGPQKAITAEQRQFVRDKVMPLLESRCFECHGAEGDPKGGLRLTGRAAVLQGGDSGPAAVPGRPDDSLLIEAIRYDGFEMPPRSKMPDGEIRILTEWVAMGLPWPDDLQQTTGRPAATKFPLEQRRQEHWAWQPIADPPVPEVVYEQWCRDPLDAFVLKKLEEADLQPAADADRGVLLRRVFFDLVGLPPTPADIRSFEQDPRDDDAALASVVDRLLASPHFGERWARHWLDLVRYAETLGHEFDYPLRHAWQYRDYVIRAMNEDVPWNQFIREHIAGDLLSEPRRHPTERFNESIIGTGFWFLHEDKHAPVDVTYEQAVHIDNQIDVLSRAFLGLTVACARCHDHKFDAISTEDYYALYGILRSTRRTTGWLDPGRRIARCVKELQEVSRRAGHLQQKLRDADLASGDTRTYIQTAIDVLNGPAPETGAGAERIPEKQAAAVAAGQSLSATLLRTWVRRLADRESQAVSVPWSLPARLANADPHAEASDIVAAWLRDVQDAQEAADSKTVLYADFSQRLPDGWSVTGPAFAGEPAALVSGSGQPHSTPGSGTGSAMLATGLAGSLFSPTFELRHPEILLRIAGEAARVRLVIDGYVMMEFNPLLFRGIDRKIDTDGAFRWVRLAGDLHRYIGHQAYLEVMDEGAGWFVLREVRFAEVPGAKPPTVTVHPACRRLADCLEQHPGADVLAASVRCAWPELLDAELVSAAGDADWLAVQKEWVETASRIPRPMPVLAATEGTGRNQPVFVRGSHRNPGKIVPRAFLTALAGPRQPLITEGSGRRELAERLLADSNPLPARVAVNRIWHHLFGRGIVATTDDFGVLGERPSHPQLLDHLATRFRREGWSVKQMIRSLILSRTYRMSTRERPEATERDPANILLHRARVRRLQGEAIRDAMLQISGRLDRRMFGPSVPVALTKFMQGRGRPKKSGPVDGDGRRSLYIMVRRNFLSPFMLAFDTPAPVTTRGRRSVSNVPAQALILLNDEFTHQQAERWAAQLLSEGDSRQRLFTRAWRQALGRSPTQEERAALNAFAEQQAVLHEETFGDRAVGPRTLADVCHVILNTKEFIYLR